MASLVKKKECNKKNKHSPIKIVYPLIPFEFVTTLPQYFSLCTVLLFYLIVYGLSVTKP